MSAYECIPDAISIKSSMQDFATAPCLPGVCPHVRDRIDHGISGDPVHVMVERMGAVTFQAELAVAAIMCRTMNRLTGPGAYGGDAAGRIVPLHKPKPMR